MQGGSATRFRFRTIAVQRLEAFETMMNKDATRFLQIKRTTRARIAKIDTLDLLSNMPYSLLPGSLHSFSVKIDHEGKYRLNRIVPRNLAAYTHSPTQLDSASYTESSELLTEDELKKLFYSIRLLQDYLRELAIRVTEFDLKSNDHAMIPAALVEALKSVEDVFSESTKGALAGLEKNIIELKNFLDTRKEQLKSSLQKIVTAMGGDVGPIEVEGPTFPLPYYRPDEWVAGNYSNHYKRFLNGQTPTAYNRDFINELLQNLILDALIHNRESWFLSKTIDDQEEEVPDLSFRLARDLAKLTEEYNPVSDKLAPVQIALFELKEKGIVDGDGLAKALVSCESMQKFLENIQESNILSFVKNSPGQLLKQIQDMVTEFNLHGIMEKELKRDFPGIFETLERLNDVSKRNELDKIYQQLTKVRATFGEIERQIRKARDLITEKATLRDVATIREQASKDIQTFRTEISQVRTECADPTDLLKKALDIDKRIITWFDELKNDLTGTSDKDALLWIGLGQAGGQILRECLTYCLQNLADARCSALLTALGINSDDKKKILQSMKEIHSAKPENVINAETELLGIFDKKAHILAINLGEEIDDLAKSDQPSYFLWGDKHKADASSQTVRTKRNILKLIESGAGAGGSTGIGRAYGFRFHSDISEAMRDVGKKGNRMPQHIVITHSLAGGSGSGMVLPVLEQARRTFGEKPVIWVISVGEGSSEKKYTAKINTPFILSDILQAAYEGIHQIYDPITLGNVRQFERNIQKNLQQMEDTAKSLLKILSLEIGDEEFLFKELKLIAGEQSTRSSEVIHNIRESLNFLESMQVMDGENGITAFSSEWFAKDVHELAASFSGPKSFKHLRKMLPDSSEKATSFSEWCEEIIADGTRPAVEFWRHWRTCLPDPFSMHLRGRDKSSQTKNDDGESPTQTFFEPDLTGDQLRQVVNSLYHEFQIEKHGKKVPYVEVKQGLNSFLELLEKHVNKIDSDRKEMLAQLDIILNKYARELDAFNNTVYRFDRHIHSLGGKGDDDGIKSIIVSNRHLEKGVEQAGGIKVSSEAYTIFNSVIFDLMLNIIGPRLPSEPGVYISTDAEKFDHKDMLGSTAPPMVVGLLNQRDSASLAEPISVGGGEARLQYPQGFEDLLNTMLNSTHYDSSGTVANPAFVEHMQIDLKFQNMFTALFGSRFRYILEINPFSGINLRDVDTDEIDESLDKLVSLWDESDETVFDLDREQRLTMSTNDGINGHHIANLIRWYGLIPPEQFSRFISQKRREEITLDKLKRSGSIWDMMKRNRPVFDIGMLKKATTLQYYRKHGTAPNTELLYELFPKMGIVNAEFLRAVGPAYLNSFLPLVMIQSEQVDDFLAAQKFSNPNKEEFTDEKQYKEFVGEIWALIKSLHTARPNGEVSLMDGGDDYSELFIDWEKEINYFLDSIDLCLHVQQVGDEVHAELKLHPRFERYLSVIRDIPAETNHKYLPARSTPASLARYLYADNPTSLLDMTSNMKKRTGIASPNFTKGLDLLKQLCFSNLLPDETRLSLPTLVRILLLTPDSSETVFKKLSSQMHSSGFSQEKIIPLVSTVLDETPYASMKSYDVPEQYCQFIETVVLRLHKLKPLIDYLIEHRPTKWTGNDDAGLKYLASTILTNEDIMCESIDDVSKVLGQDTESIPDLKDWFQVIINDVVKEVEADLGNGEDEEGDENEDQERLSVSNENPTILKIKQLFYDLVTTTSEAFYQAEYFKNEGKDSRNVHFEMTGFSDRLLGQPSGLLLMMHDRNVNLPMNIIKQNARSSLAHFLSDFANPKEFSTASDFGPSSFLTMVFTMAPAADLADQFQELMINPQSGLGGQNPDWALRKSKLHPYMLLYNILWLSKSVVGEWSMRNNKAYSRRFQIPVSVIEHHYQSPKQIFEDARDMQQNTSDFPGEVTMPPSDSRAYARALKSKISGPPLRNIVRLIGIMALRYEHVVEVEKGEPTLWKSILEPDEYTLLRSRVHDSEITVDIDHLMTPGQSAKKTEEKPAVIKRWGKKKRSTSSEGQRRDTAEERAKAWFEAYKAWIRYEPSEDEVEGTRSDANLFKISSEQPTSLVTNKTSPPTVSSGQEIPSENSHSETTRDGVQDETLEFN